MRIEDYPRPQNDTGIGFYYFPDPHHFDRAHLDRWVPRLRALGASWLVLETPHTRPVPDLFLQRLMMVDIEPVVILKSGPIAPMDERALAGTLSAMADSGLHYVVFYDRPNDRASWSPQSWSKPALVERFVDTLVPGLKLAAAQGLNPVLPPLEPMGAYWDTTFLQSMLSSLRRRGLEPLMQRAAVGIRNFANDHPLDWGKGGPEAWPQARPYAEQIGGQDHRGFCLFDWYRPLIEAALGRSLPLIACANGPQASQIGRRPLDPQDHARRAAEMARLITDRQLPPVVFNHAFWLLSAERGGPGYRERWFEPDGTPRLPAVAALQELNSGRQRTLVSRRAASPRRAAVQEGGAARPAAPAPAPASGASSVPPAGNGHKVIDHYLLLPLFEWGATRWHLSIVQDYIEACLPTCGFSVREAQLAHRVTIIGNEQGISLQDQQMLEAAGCQVQRIAGRNGSETEKLLRELAQNMQLSHRNSMTTIEEVPACSVRS